MTANRICVILGLALFFVPSACQSGGRERVLDRRPSTVGAAQEVQGDRDTGNRVIAPPPSTNMVYVDAGISRSSWPWNKHYTVARIQLSPPAGGGALVGLEFPPPDNQSPPFTVYLTRSTRGETYEVRIESRGGDLFRARVGGRSVLFRGSGDDGGWANSQYPTVTLNPNGDDVEVTIERYGADMTFKILEAEAVECSD